MTVVVGQVRPTFPVLVRRFRVLAGDGVVQFARVCGPILALGSLSLLVVILVWPGPGHHNGGPHLVDLVVIAVGMAALGVLPELGALAWLARIRLGRDPGGWRRFVAGDRAPTLPVRLVGIIVLAAGCLVSIGNAVFAFTRGDGDRAVFGMTTVEVVAIGVAVCWLPELMATIIGLIRLRSPAPAPLWSYQIDANQIVTANSPLAETIIAGPDRPKVHLRRHGWLVTVAGGPRRAAGYAILLREAFAATDTEHLDQLLRTLGTCAPPSPRD